ncbi:MAG: hypothetical protein Q7U57_16040, partial [Methylovulum sp.]|nr:hypothetical protein [Methylovulum sp.]
MSTHINDKLDELGSSGSNQGIAYQTLLGSNTALPNIKDDPIWTTSDNALGQKTSDINEQFTGCEKNTTFSEKSCSVHVKDLRTCKKAAKAEVCRVNRQIKEIPVKALTRMAGSESFFDSALQVNFTLTREKSGDGYTKCTGSDQRCMVLDIHDLGRIKTAVIDWHKVADVVQFKVNGTVVYTTGSCHDSDPEMRPNFDFKSQLVEGRNVFEIGFDRNCIRYSNSFKVVISKLPDYEDVFMDTPAGCRERLFNVWSPHGTPPSWTIEETMNDKASTEWWQCTDADDSRTFGGLTIDSSVPESHSFLQDILPDPPETPPAPICYQAETRPPGHVKLPCFTDLDGYQVCPIGINLRKLRQTSLISRMIDQNNNQAQKRKHEHFFKSCPCIATRF